MDQQMRSSILCLAIAVLFVSVCNAQELTPKQLEIIRKAEQNRIEAINKAMPSVIAIYGDDRQGGGSGVIIDPSGIGLTNHHVIMAAGVEGWGGLADGKLYRWKLIGTDPGGDVSLIQMEKEGDEPFPYTNLGDSDEVKVGDWALAMGNPFVLTEDQKPTVTLGIVSGVKRYQHGAGQNQLVYGNCIQVDSSINPGNSGGPLFNMNAEVIGINGRGSFQDRGRVNVGLGYAISSNQIKNFIPDLLATKLVEHGTLDASFSDRGGKVVCSEINQDAPVARAGLELGDELISFENVAVTNANQYTNLICTLPEDWPANLQIRKSDGRVLSLDIRMFGLPYSTPSTRPPDSEDKDPDAQRQVKMQQEMFDLLAATPGTIRKKDINKRYADFVIEQSGLFGETDKPSIEIVDEIWENDQKVGKCVTRIASDGRFKVNWEQGGEELAYIFDGKEFAEIDEGALKVLTLTESKLTLQIVQAFACAVNVHQSPYSVFGKVSLDGSDKAQSANAYRFKLLDDEEDWFYFWMSMYNTDGKPGVRLVRASADIDCDPGEGAVSFLDWREQAGWTVPHAKSFVFGLSEQPMLTMKTIKVQEIEELDESIFEITESGN